MPTTVAELAAAAELEPVPTATTASQERFAGYGIMGLPFASGHVLAMRRFPASSVGPAYTSVWHRDPDDRWTFWQDQPAEVACPRYFSAALDDAATVPIELEWIGPETLHLEAPDVGLDWTTTLRSSTVTSVLNAVGDAMPERWWRSPTVLSAMGALAGGALRAGHLGLAGVAPNGQRFVANPRKVWLVADATARVRGEDVGPPGPLDRQASLGDFWIPQRGLFALGRAYFTVG